MRAPFAFLNRLGVASSSCVGAPWIEFLDAKDRLFQLNLFHWDCCSYAPPIVAGLPLLSDLAVLPVVALPHAIHNPI